MQDIGATIELSSITLMTMMLYRAAQTAVDIVQGTLLLWYRALPLSLLTVPGVL